MPPGPLAHYSEFPFTAPVLGEDVTRTVYRRGAGPGVVIMHEVPGLYPEVVRFADLVVDAGFTVFLPHLFGEPGKELSVVYSLEGIARACVAREFKVFAANASSPITEWLRALCRHAHAELGGPGVGALGMCLTGNFALALMVDPSVMAPVLSQPSLPFAIGPESKAAIHVSPAELAVIKRRTREEGVDVLGLRFTHDFMCPGARFETLRRELGEHFVGIEIDSGPGNAGGLPRTAHSVLAMELRDDAGHPTQQALQRVLAFFREKLVAR